MAETNPDAAQYLSFAAIRCSMHRERTKNQPSVPNTLASLYDILQSSDIIQNIYKENVITSDGKNAIILSTNYLLQALSSATEIYVDGTFSVLPCKPHIAQLYSVHMRYMDTGIATLFILCDVRTITMYDALWDKITQLIPQLEQNIKFIMSDFEMAAVKSLNKKFPRAKLTGCWFHFNQAVLRKWRKLRLSNVPKKILSMTMALPLLPPDMFQEALLIIQTKADELSNEHPDILQFMSYLRLTWSNMALKISTYRCPVRTNNIVESFHNIAAQKLGTRNINVWTFLDKLSYLITDQELDLRRLNNGVRSRRLRTRARRELDSKIINAQEDLVNKRLSLNEFLLIFTTNNNILPMEQMEQIVSMEDAELTTDEQINMELFSDDLDETIQQTRRQNRHRSRRIHNNVQREDNTLEDNDEESSDMQTIINENEIIISDTETENTIVVEDEPVNTESSSSEIEQVWDTRNNQGEIPANTQAVRQHHDITSENNIEINEDESIYEVPYDDYSYLNDANDATSGIPYHPVDWNLEDTTASEEECTKDICTVCLINERTHAFIPCGHLACCFLCIERLEADRCPICNVTYDNYVRIRKP
ncbi:uncharacterized protein [Linepithema humile]|uniref:uncharacterized protein isoform X2 n=1 Tax=Linepithema humile TaxID=83485 RepID=UPI00351F5766